MATMNHIPGPWAAGIGGLGSKEHVYTADGETMIADCCRGSSRAVGQANARLIAAAPDLLATAINFLAVIDGSYAQVMHAAGLMKAAVAKATE